MGKKLKFKTTKVRNLVTLIKWIARTNEKLTLPMVVEVIIHSELPQEVDWNVPVLDAT